MKTFIYILTILATWINIATGQTNITSDVQIHSGGGQIEYVDVKFTSGYVLTPRNEPTANFGWANGATSTGASNASHVNGYALKIGNAAFTFPIGSIIT